jgi:transposase
MLADETDFVIGVDAHRDQHVAAVVRSQTGLALTGRAIPSDRAGYRAALCWAHQHAPGRRAWALESSGGYAAGLTRFLLAQGERVIEIDRPARNDTRGHLKDDGLDAIRAAQTALGRSQAALQPRRGERREALRVLQLTRRSAIDARRIALNQLRSLIVTAPDELRHELRQLTTRARLLRRCQRLRPTTSMTPAERANRIALRGCAQRIEALTAEAHILERELTTHVRALAPALLDEPGIGPISAAAILIAYSHHGRFPNEAHFARLAGAAPIPASSGLRPRMRLNPRGDRDLNRALHTIVIARRKHHAPTRDYLQRRTHDGKTGREATRCLKRYVARHVYRLLQQEATLAA